ncbi:rCG36296 [Rattus norvegicus]|uniref:RCG36296 n=1 Tax=Rattus norvegicus TaxID=10116 RepID=A6IQ15_RAT|nr:rCG36296 [Rattus norvegicus]
MITREEKLHLAQIYNGNETDLFWTSIPENTQASGKDTYLPGRKNQPRMVVYPSVCKCRRNSQINISHYWKSKGTQNLCV